MFKHLSLIFLLCFPLLIRAEVDVRSAPDYTAAIERLTEFVEEKMKEENIPGLSVALVDGEKIIWSRGFGLADKENKKEATENTFYRVGSLTTVFTALAILQLAEEDKLSLDDPVVEHLPTFSLQAPPERVRQITIRHLLTHHAGLPLSIFKGMWTENPETLKQFMPKIADLRPSYPVNEVYAYSNLGYDILGRLIEVRSGMNYREYMQKHVFVPLGLDSSNFSQAVFNDDNFSRGYKKAEVKDFLPVRDIPALGLNSNARDLAKFMIFMLNAGKHNDVLGFDVRKEMLNAQNRHVELDLNKDIGYGWQLGGMQVAPGELVVWRQGATLLHRSRMALMPQHQLGAVVLANSSKAFGTAGKVIEEGLRLMLQEKAGLLGEKENKNPGKPPGEPMMFADAYSTYLGLLRLRDAGDEYKLDLMGWGFELIPRGDGWYRLEYDLFGFIPIKLDWVAEVSVAPVKINGHDIAVVRHNGINYLFGERIEPYFISPTWNERLGTYEPAERDALLKHYDVTEGKLIEEDGFMMFEYRLPYWVPLRFRLPVKPLANDVALIPGLGTGLNTYVQVIKVNGEERLNYSGYDLIKED